MTKSPTIHTILPKDSQLGHLAVLAILHGLSPTPPERCRVLELACGRGGNLIPQARDYPDSRFVGVDLSARHVEDARRTAQSLGLKNIEFIQKNVMDIDPGFGSFDYIFNFGTFSWVPIEVQDRILDICAKNLTADGIALIHYAIYPAAHSSEAVRNMLQYQLQQYDDPVQRLEMGTEVLGFMTRSTAACEQHTYQKMLDGLYRSTFTDSRNFYHEYLNTSSHALYFSEFVERARGHGLQFLSEAAAPFDSTIGFPDEVEQALSMEPDVVRREQYRDFLTLRNIRQTLLCHPRSGLRRWFPPQELNRFYISSPVTAPVAAETSARDATESFVLDKVGALNTAHPLSATAMRILAARWPLGATLEELTGDAIQKMGKEAPVQGEARDTNLRLLATTLLKGFRYGLVELRMTPPDCVNTVSPCPRVSDLVRTQVQHTDFRWVTNQRHGNVPLEGLSQRLVPYLDGKHNREQLTDILVDMAEQGEFNISERGEPVLEADRIRTLIEEAVGRELSNFMRASLLVA